MIAAGNAEDKPKPITPADDIQVKLLKAQQKINDIEIQKKTMENQFKDLEKQASQINAQYPQLQAQQNEANTELDKVVEEAYKAANVDKAKYDFDKKSLTFVPKTAPAPATPSPEKK